MGKKAIITVVFVLAGLALAAYLGINYGNPQWHWRLYAYQARGGEIDLAPAAGYTGEWNRWDSEGRLLATYSYRNGKRNGPYTTYAAAGNLLSHGQYVDDQLDGIQVINQEGGARTEIPCKNGKRNGVETTWYESGQVAVEAPWMDDVQHGSVVFYFESGMRHASIPFYNGKIEGVQQSWYEDGMKQGEENFRNNLKNGKSEFWNPDGSLEMSLNFHDDKMDGRQTWYYANGNRARMMELTDGTPNGHWLEWDEDGNITVDHVYKMGVLDADRKPEDHADAPVEYGPKPPPVKEEGDGGTMEEQPQKQ